ncbi:MAG: futalosine hydrolase [Deltaproteobacteria bacterium]|nr:futalosine hydrolase [Deltaproteobacteria bacterium]
MKPVLIIAAVPQELSLLKEALGKGSRRGRSAFGHVTGAIGGRRVVLCAAGVGKVNAAAATAALIERFRPGLVINTGCAGAYAGSGLAIGDLATAGEEILGDEGVLTAAGWQDLNFMGLPSLLQGERRWYNEIPLCGPAAGQAVRLAEKLGLRLVRGRFVTVSTCSGSSERGEELALRFGAICENMEGAAVALTCLRYGIDCLEVRGISNQVEERDMKRWDIPAAVAAAQRFVLSYIEDMNP